MKERDWITFSELNGLVSTLPTDFKGIGPWLSMVIPRKPIFREEFTVSSIFEEYMELEVW